MTTPASQAKPAIRTPDQRLRIFVSSTLRELEPERRAARAAVERLHLAPVMFELGARPHPPRDLYRAYLGQSDVFVGVYWERYGWVAPGEDVSGLEDEYRLAPRAMPKLIYVKEPADREERLDGLIARIQADDTASYKAFGTPDELAHLLEADLATLLAERFDASRVVSPDDHGVPAVDDAAPRPPSFSLPVPYTRLVGRTAEVADVVALLADRDQRLVTLLGPGGIGKSRLAIAVAEAARPHFADGVVFAMLENVLEPDLLLPTLAYELGIRDTGEVPLERRVEIAFAGRRVLVVLDNFEQLVDAAPLLVRLYALAPDATFLVTSRAVLRVRGERVYEVPPLATNDPASPTSVSRALASPAVELFVERARAVKPDFEVTTANAAAVTGVCAALQGLPLAIELAAARMRVLTPAAILQRLDRQLPLLVDSSRDLPERQRTLRSTIEWSTGLLRDPERALLADLGVFSGDFTLEAVEAIGDGRPWSDDALGALGALVDFSLVRQREAEGEPVFALLGTVREFAVGVLREHGDEREMRDRHARFYAGLARREAERLAGGATQRDAVARLTLERENLRAAVRHLVEVGDAETATEIAWRLYLFWWIGGYFLELSVWMTELVAHGGQLSPHERAVARFYVLWEQMWSAPTPRTVREILEVADLFAESGDRLGVAMATATAGLAQVASGDPDLDSAAERLRSGADTFRAIGARWGEVLTLVALGRLEWVRGRQDAARRFFRLALEAAEAGGDDFGATVASHQLGRALLVDGQVEEAARVFGAGLAYSLELGHADGIAYGLEGLCAIAAIRHDVERAGVLAGAAAAIRQRVGMYEAPVFVFHERYVEGLRTAENSAALDGAVARGREFGAREAAEFALTPST